MLIPCGYVLVLHLVFVALSVWVFQIPGPLVSLRSLPRLRRKEDEKDEKEASLIAKDTDASLGSGSFPSVRKKRL